MHSRDSSLNVSIPNKNILEPKESQKPLLLTKSDSEPSQSNLGKIIYFSIAFFFLSAAFSSSQGLLVDTYKQVGYDYLAEVFLLPQYVVTFVALFISPTVVKGWSYKFGVAFPSLGFISPMITVATITSCIPDSDYFWCSGTVMTYLSNLGAGVTIGISAPAFWLSANRYVNSFTTAENKGRTFGIFFAFIAVGQVAGNLMSYLLIERYGRTVFYLVCGGCAIVNTIMLVFSPSAPKYHEEWAKESTFSKAKRIVGLALNTELKVLAPFIFFTGLAYTLNNGFQYQSVATASSETLSDSQGYLNVLIFLIQGFFAVVVSYLAGIRLDNASKKEELLNITNYVYDIALAFSILAYFFSSLVLAYFMGIGWGIGYSGALVLVYAIVAKDFDGTIESFAVVMIVIVVADFVGVVMNILMPQNVPGIIFIALVFLGASQICTRFFETRKEEVKEKSEL